jgi:hypothetical protein
VLTLAAPGSAPAPRGWRSADTYHPPPGADRNLPLRL